MSFSGAIQPATRNGIQEVSAVQTTPARSQGPHWGQETSAYDCGLRRRPWRPGERRLSAEGSYEGNGGGEDSGWETRVSASWHRMDSRKMGKVELEPYFSMRKKWGVWIFSSWVGMPRGCLSRKTQAGTHGCESSAPVSSIRTLSWPRMLPACLLFGRYGVKTPLLGKLLRRLSLKEIMYSKHPK